MGFVFCMLQLGSQLHSSRYSLGIESITRSSKAIIHIALNLGIVLHEVKNGLCM